MKFNWCYGKSEMTECHEIRKQVFVIEQGFNEELEFDYLDDTAYHLLVKENDTPVATARLFLQNNDYHCGRVCVLKEYRDRKIGLEMMEKIEEKARELGAKKMTLSAQKTAIAFYEKAGYTKYGQEYLDEFCPHISMQKDLL